MEDDIVKKLEIKAVGIISAFKATLYMSIIPMAFIFVIGIIMVFVGIMVQEYTILGIGIAYSLMPIFGVLFYGVISMLGALIYNWLAGKFGGLEITVKEKEEPQKPAVNASYTNAPEQRNEM